MPTVTRAASAPRALLTLNEPGRRSVVRGIRVATLKTTRTNALTYAPKGGDGYYTAIPVTAGSRVKVSVRMDPKLAGIPVYASFFGPKGLTTKQARLSRSGRTSVSLTLPKAVGIQVIVQLPRRKGRQISYEQQPTVYYTAG